MNYHTHSKPNFQTQHCEVYDQNIQLKELGVCLILPLDLTKSKSNDLKQKLSICMELKNSWKIQKMYSQRDPKKHSAWSPMCH